MDNAVADDAMPLERETTKENVAYTNTSEKHGPHTSLFMVKARKKRCS